MTYLTEKDLQGSFQTVFSNGDAGVGFTLDNIVVKLSPVMAKLFAKELLKNSEIAINKGENNGR